MNVLALNSGSSSFKFGLYRVRGGPKVRQHVVNDAQARAAICGGLSWSGVSLDVSRTSSASNLINDGAPCCSVQGLAWQEDEQIARRARALVVA